VALALEVEMGSLLDLLVRLAEEEVELSEFV
jgi:hypothetical protein